MTFDSWSDWLDHAEKGIEITRETFDDFAKTEETALWFFYIFHWDFDEFWDIFPDDSSIIQK